MSQLKAVFFDLGDTITDLGEGRGDYEARVLARAARVYHYLADAQVSLPEEPAFCRALAESSEAQYQAALAEQRGLMLAHALRRFFDTQGIIVSPSLLAGSVDAYCRGAGGPVTLRLGAAETLSVLAQCGLALGVISNTIQPGHYLDETLQRSGLLPFFAVRIYSSDAGVAKPHPAIFQAALAALGVTAAEAVHVGDRPEADIAGAQGAGLRAILIRVRGRPAGTAPSIIPEATIAELPELPEILQRWAVTLSPSQATLD